MDQRYSVIPEVFYDFIARIPAGTVFLTSFYLLLECNGLVGPLPGRDFPGASVVTPIVALIGCYVTGYVLSQLGGEIFKRGYKIFKLDDKFGLNIAEFEVLCGRQGDEPHYFNFKEDYNTEDVSTERMKIKMYVFLKHRDTQIAMEMAKHQAETALFQSLTVGFLLLFLLASAIIVCRLFASWPNARVFVHDICFWLSFMLAAFISVWVALKREKKKWQYYIEFCRALFKIPNT